MSRRAGTSSLCMVCVYRDLLGSAEHTDLDLLKSAPGRRKSMCDMQSVDQAVQLQRIDASAARDQGRQRPRS
jgi:hypothetical protein